MTQAEISAQADRGPHGDVGREQLGVIGEAVGERPLVAHEPVGMEGVPIVDHGMEKPQGYDLASEDIEDVALGVLGAERRVFQVLYALLEP